MERRPAVYILASKRNGTLYIGVTSNLAKRASQHRLDPGSAFSHKYDVYRLVYYEAHENMISAITREKQLKKWKRSWKIRLIEERNLQWRDLEADLRG